MATLKGKWKFNEDIVLPAETIKASCVYDWGTDTYLSDEELNYTEGIVFRPEGLSVGGYAYYIYRNGSWVVDYPTWSVIDFGETERIVSNKFYECFTANAVQLPADTVTVTYNGTTLASLEAGQTATLKTAGGELVGDIVVSVPDDSPLPVEIYTEEEMTALLETAEIGAICKYVGESKFYESGELYMIVHSSDGAKGWQLLCSNELRGTWVFNDVINYPDTNGIYYNLKFRCPMIENERFVCIGLNYMYRGMIYYTDDDITISAYWEGAWQSEDYKTIFVDSNLSESYIDANFFSWLKQNATKIS